MTKGEPERSYPKREPERPSFTWNERDKEKRDEYKGFLPYDPCFIATTVYGDINHPNVQELRNFRDDILMKSVIGQKFVEFYYSGTGEKTANFIKNHAKSTIPIIRTGLDLIVNHYKKD